MLLKSIRERRYYRYIKFYSKNAIRNLNIKMKKTIKYYED